MHVRHDEMDRFAEDIAEMKDNTVNVVINVPRGHRIKKYNGSRKYRANCMLDDIIF